VPLELGFLSFVPNHGGAAGAAAALEDGLRLFEHAEQLGFATGWVRGRHFEPFLTSPMTFFAAAAQHNIRAVIAEAKPVTGNDVAAGIDVDVGFE